MTPALTALLDKARRDLADGKLTSQTLDEIAAVASALSQISTGRAEPRLCQKLLYLHAAQPSVASPLINATLYDPKPGHKAQIDPLAKAPTYNSVLDAIRDGWRVVQFPEQRGVIEDREIDILGYEFILEKLEQAHD